jgi:DNA polymerase III delta prime subunit
MGSVLVAAMVQDTVSDGPKKLHPFFTASRSAVSSPAVAATSSAEPSDVQIEDTQESKAVESGERPPKRRKTDTHIEENEHENKKARQTRRKAAALLGSPITSHLVSTNGASSALEGDQLPDTDAAATKVQANVEVRDSKDSKNTNDNPLPVEPLSQAPLASLNTDTVPQVPLDEALPSKGPSTPAKPKKILKYNPKTGTIGSPPKSKSIPAESKDKIQTIKRGRKPQSVVATITYGETPEDRARIGARITEILEGTSSGSDSRADKAGDAIRAEDTRSSEAPAKEPHPFFVGKSSSKPSAVAIAPTKAPRPSPPARKTIMMSTPCSPKRHRVGSSALNLPQFGVKSTGLKVPGAAHPVWPPKDMVHVRGGDSETAKQWTPIYTLPLSSRKSKGQVVDIAPQESVIGVVGEGLNLGGLAATMKNLDLSTEYEPVPTALRLPQKHCKSGRRLQAQVRPQLRTFRDSSATNSRESSADELSAAPSKACKVHPAVDRLYKALETQLSAYDRSDCENSCWAQKYAPLCAGEVLQVGSEAALIKEWLETLKVQSVDTGNSEMESKKPGPGAKPGSSSRRKRKKNKLDGFVVSSDEENDEMDEVSDNEGDWAPASGQGMAKRTVIRSGDVIAKGSRDAGRLTNTILISGPHGSGKTAAVYAIASELGFEVFEINASSRRNGRDVLEKVGDMTRNHLVQQHRAEEKVPGEESSVEDETSRDLKSGRQSTMASFFKPKTGKPKPAVKQVVTQSPAIPKTAVAPKPQKQSLILLEEVDILYEEDKQFWTTVIGLIAQSKRPLIMTCNDESLVPVQSLSLHGIFRFGPPRTDLAVDVLLLAAANEGHALQRPAVETLYESRSKDLRASFMELNYWCQIGIGDRRGGFDWFYPRWPKGCDIDENGHVVRVISEGTYSEAMGWLGRDTLHNCETPRCRETETLLQTWDSWGADLGSWDAGECMEKWVQSLAPATLSASGKMAALDMYEAYSDALSTADVCSAGAFRMAHQVRNA